MNLYIRTDSQLTKKDMNITPAKEKYSKIVVEEMRKKFGYKGPMAVPRIGKVVVNVGIGKFAKEGEKVEEVASSGCYYWPKTSQDKSEKSNFRI